jgi:hypothetical protein
VTKKLLSDQFREQLQALGSSLGAHTRTLEQHFESQEAFLALRHQELDDAAHAALLGGQGPAEALELALAPLTQGNLNLLTVAELKRLCSNEGLTGYSKYKKAELITLLSASGVKPPPPSVKKLTRAQLEAIALAALANHP